MNKVEEVVKLFGEGLNCSQAMMVVFGEQFKIDPLTARRLGRPWGGGIGHLGQTCGALTGAVMILGLARDEIDEGKARMRSFDAVKKLFQRFEQRHGTTMCKALLGEDMTTEEGARRIKEENLVRKICPEYVRSAALILSELV